MSSCNLDNATLTISKTPTIASVTHQNLYLRVPQGSDGTMTSAPGIGFIQEGYNWGNIKMYGGEFHFMSHDLSSYVKIVGSAIRVQSFGITATIGPLNEHYVHFQNSASVPWWFDTDIRIQGCLNIYQCDKRGCGSTLPDSPAYGDVFFKFT